MAISKKEPKGTSPFFFNFGRPYPANKSGGGGEPLLLLPDAVDRCSAVKFPDPEYSHDDADFTSYFCLRESRKITRVLYFLNPQIPWL